MARREHLTRFGVDDAIACRIARMPRQRRRRWGVRSHISADARGAFLCPCRCGVPTQRHGRSAGGEPPAAARAQVAGADDPRFGHIDVPGAARAGLALSLAAGEASCIRLHHGSGRPSPGCVTSSSHATRVYPSVTVDGYGSGSRIRPAAVGRSSKGVRAVRSSGHGGGRHARHARHDSPRRLSRCFPHCAPRLCHELFSVRVSAWGVNAGSGRRRRRT